MTLRGKSPAKPFARRRCPDSNSPAKPAACFRQYRVRDHDILARIEVFPSDMDLLLRHRQRRHKAWDRRAGLTMAQDRKIPALLETERFFNQVL